jgi:hypothetical protein
MEPAGRAQVAAVVQAGLARPHVRLVWLSMAGYEPTAVKYVASEANAGIVLLDRSHFEAILCGLATPAAVLAEASHRALFDNRPYTSLTQLMIGDTTTSAPPQFLPADRRPAPRPLLVRAAPGMQVLHMLTGDSGWGEPLGLAVVDTDRVLVTVTEGIVEVDLKRGSTDWLLPLSGCRGRLWWRPTDRC